MVKSNFYLISLFYKQNEVVIKVFSDKWSLERDFKCRMHERFSEVQKYRQGLIHVLPFEKAYKMAIQKVSDGYPQLPACLALAHTKIHSIQHTNEYLDKITQNSIQINKNSKLVWTHKKLLLSYLEDDYNASSILIYFHPHWLSKSHKIISRLFAISISVRLRKE